MGRASLRSLHAFLSPECVAASRVVGDSHPPSLPRFFPPSLTHSLPHTGSQQTLWPCKRPCNAHI
jgi:hypothetical protein